MATVNPQSAQALVPDPEVPVYLDRYHGSWKAYLICPHCGDLHTHGAGPADAPPDLGNRASHCIWHPSEGYWLVPALTEKPQRPNRRTLQRIQQEGEALTARQASKALR
jgi:hypothetical protein